MPSASKPIIIEPWTVVSGFDVLSAKVPLIVSCSSWLICFSTCIPVILVVSVALFFASAFAPSVTIAPSATDPETNAPLAIAPLAIAPLAIAPLAIAPEAIAPEETAPEAIEPLAKAPLATCPDAILMSLLVPRSTS